MNLQKFRVWDRSIRVFHWLNVICFVLLVFGGTAIHYTQELGLSLSGNVFLKTLHTLIGYVFVANLCWRILWGFIGSYYARWRQVLPFGRGYVKSVVVYVRGFAMHKTPSHLGHNPLGRFAVTLFMVVFVTQGVTGLSLAGTDLYMPPFGDVISEYIAAPLVNPSEVRPHVPGSMDASLRAEMLATVSPKPYAKMRAIRDPIVTLHIWCYYFLLILAALHIAAVVLTEIRADENIISAMFTGKKIFRDMPVDLPERGNWHQNSQQSSNNFEHQSMRMEGQK